MSPELVAAALGLGLSLERAAEAASVLKDPGLPGEPWPDTAIAEALEDVATLAAGGSLAVPATTLRWLAAIDTGEVAAG